MAKLIQEASLNHDLQRMESNFFRKQDKEILNFQDLLKDSSSRHLDTLICGDIALTSRIRVDASLDSGYILEMEYLLLDVRDEEEYVKSHIIGALNYPKRFFKQDVFFKDLLNFKSKMKMIILYDFNETDAIQVAIGLCERGFQSTHVLSLGFLNFKAKYPDLLK